MKRVILFSAALTLLYSASGFSMPSSTPSFSNANGTAAAAVETVNADGIQKFWSKLFGTEGRETEKFAENRDRLDEEREILEAKSANQPAL